MLTASWRPVVKYLGAGKSLKHERCEIGLGGNVDTMGISKGYRSELTIFGELLYQHAAAWARLSASHPLFIGVTGNIHTVLNVDTFTFLYSSPGKTSKTGKLRLFGEAARLAQGHPWCRAGLEPKSRPLGVTPSSFRCLSP